MATFEQFRSTFPEDNVADQSRTNLAVEIQKSFQ